MDKKYKIMKLQELKEMTPVDLLAYAEERGLENASSLRRQEQMLATAFHPELTDDTRLHRRSVEMAGTR